MAGLVLLTLLVAVAYAGPFVTRWGWAGVDVTAFGDPPSAVHWLGTTPTGRDMYAVTVRALRRSLVIGLLVASGSTGLAAVTGTAAGHLGGWADRLLRWVTDLILVLPPFLVAAVASRAIGGTGGTALLLTCLLWPITARAVRAATRSLRDEGYVLAARQLGAPTRTIVRRHVLPSLTPLLLADATLNTGAAIVAESGLSYFGFGVRPPDVSLGTLIADGAPSATVFPWLFLPPVVALVLVLLAVDLAGAGLPGLFSPRERG
ncbi:ABC transporter permease [Actinoallomurus rhizosphaericola]|uniref:ABC transporter permease n=1 Tax=Actinoallomurus rhizosphaericola TaxID=2952536 RepID=UPI0020908F5B|nr:ABC transporter permease [Actinoallomurus rhizosphaericola]MCO5992418.1 ABC transporter permease [Actinoallomurus rhizosphaericola]